MSASGDSNSLSDLASVRELLDFLAQNRLEAVRIDVPEDEGESNSDEDAAAGATTARSTARRKFVLRRRRNRARGPSAHGAATASPSRSPTEDPRGDQPNALSDLASVTEMLEFLAQNRLERVRIEIPTAEKPSSSSKQKKTKKRRRRSAAVLEKDRAFAKTVYYKTLSTLKELQEEVARLEAEHKELVARKQRRNPPSLAATTHQQADVPDGALHLDLQGLKERYLALVLERDTLHSENLALEDKNKAFEQSRKNLIQLAGVETRANARAFAEWEKRSERPREDEIRPLTAEYCAQVTARAYDRVLELRAKTPTSFTWGADLFGWKDFRSTENNCLMCSLEKIFLFQTAVDITNKFWEISTFEDYDQRCYSPSLKVRFHVLQRVDENNVVIYRTIDRPGGENGVELRMKTIVLVSRVFLGTDEGWIIFSVAVDPARVLVHLTNPPKGRTRLEPVREEMWIDNLKWMICEPMGESAQHCKQILGGVLDGIATANPSQWILEELMVGIRHERGGTGPFTILTD